MKKNNMMILFLFLGIAHGLGAQETELGPTSLDATVQKLIQLRSDVERKSLRLEQSQKTRMLELDSLNQRKNELEQQFSRERLKSQVSEAQKSGLQDLGNHQKTLSKARPEDLQFVKNWIQDLKTWVESGLPYKKEARLAELNKVQERLESQPSEPLEILVQDLWGFTEKEIQLTGSNRFEIIKLDLGKELSAAQVARIGMLQMYFKTAESKVGRAEKGPKGWSLVIKTEDSEVKAIERILAKLKQEKGGAFLELPGLPENPEGGGL